MSIDLYCANPSPHSRAVLLLVRALGIEVNKKEIDIFQGEHLGDDFAAINPRKCIPAIVDGDLTLWDSHAVLMYLANKFDEEGTFYPKEASQRAKVDYMLLFNVGDLVPRMFEYYGPIAKGGEEPDAAKWTKLNQSLTLLNNMICDDGFAAGERVTIADFALIATISSLVAFGADISEHENILNWISRCSEEMEGYEEENGEGAELFAQLFMHKAG